MQRPNQKWGVSVVLISVIASAILLLHSLVPAQSAHPTGSASVSAAPGRDDPDWPGDNAGLIAQITALKLRPRLHEFNPSKLQILDGNNWLEIRKDDSWNIDCRWAQSGSQCTVWIRIAIVPEHAFTWQSTRFVRIPWDALPGVPIPSRLEDAKVTKVVRNYPMYSGSGGIARVTDVNEKHIDGLGLDRCGGSFIRLNEDSSDWELLFIRSEAAAVNLVLGTITYPVDTQ
jgi:hypothetical protein